MVKVRVFFRKGKIRKQKIVEVEDFDKTSKQKLSKLVGCSQLELRYERVIDG